MEYIAGCVREMTCGLILPTRVQIGSDSVAVIRHGAFPGGRTVKSSGCMKMAFPMETFSIRCDVAIFPEVLILAMTPTNMHATHSNETDPAGQEHGQSSLIFGYLGP